MPVALNAFLAKYSAKLAELTGGGLTVLHSHTGGGGGDMYKATYDSDANGIIEADHLNLSSKAAASHAHAPSDVTGTAVVTADSRLSDSRPASDVSSWAKAGTKPTYTYTEVGAAATSHSHAESDVTGLVTDLGNKQATLVSATNIKTINSASILGSGDLVVSGVTNIKQTEIDFGATPVAENSFLITDADVLVGSQLIGNVAYEAPTGKDLDELEMDGLDLKFAPGSGQFTLYARGLDGYIADKFKVNYLVG